MSTVRKAIAAVVVAGTLVVAPLTIIAGQSQQAGVKTVTVSGGQGGWPFKM